MDRIHDLFSGIHAEDILKANISAFLSNEIRRRSKAKKWRLQYAYAAASLALILLFGGFSIRYFTVSSYLDIDVNPAIELSVNPFGRVIEAAPYNKDGEDVLEAVQVKHMAYDEAVTSLINAMSEKGYVENGGLLSATIQTSNADAEEAMLAKLQNALASSLAGNSVDIDVFPVSREIKEEAHEHHLSPAKFLAISELQNLDATIDFEECEEHSIGEIKDLIESNSINHHSQKSDGGQSQSKLDASKAIEDEEMLPPAGNHHNERGGHGTDGY
jgi:hypothetical protein